MVFKFLIDKKSVKIISISPVRSVKIVCFSTQKVRKSQKMKKIKSVSTLNSPVAEEEINATNRFITFDDKPTRGERWKSDKFACMREIFELFNVRCASIRFPSVYLAVNEPLYPYRGRIGFKQYNPSKPAKYGLHYRSLSDAETPYTYFILPYAGKPTELVGDVKK